MLNKIMQNSVKNINIYILSFLDKKEVNKDKKLKGFLKIVSEK